MRNTLHETLDASSSLIETAAFAVSLEVIRAKEPLHHTSLPSSSVAFTTVFVCSLTIWIDCIEPCTGF